MRTVYEVRNKSGRLFAECDTAGDADVRRVGYDSIYTYDAPHTVVKRQVAGPEDTDELLRLRALVDDLLLIAGQDVDDDVTRVVRNVLNLNGFGGES